MKRIWLIHGFGWLLVLCAGVGCLVVKTPELSRPKAASLVRQAAETLVEKHQPFAAVELARYRGRIKPEFVLPQTHLYDRRDIDALKRYAAGCDFGIISDQLREKLRKDKSNRRPNQAALRSRSLRKALEWQDFLCGAIDGLSENFFSRPPSQHIFGVSYTRLARESSIEKFKSPEFRKRVLEYEHVLSLASYGADRPELSPELAVLTSLNAYELSALYQEPMVFAHSHVLVRANLSQQQGGTSDAFRGGAQFYAFPRELLLERVPLKLIQASEWQTARRDQTCLVDLQQRCFVERKNEGLQAAMLGSWVLGLMLIVGSALYVTVLSLSQRRQVLKDRQFVFQMLTHELRTPITSLALSANRFRDAFDSLPDDVQKDAMDIFTDVARLRRVAETSRAYLEISRGDGQNKAPVFDDEKNPSILDFLREISADRGGASEFVEVRGEDSPFAVSSYWLGFCVGNLLDNAMRHGKPPVVIETHCDGNMREIRVVDAGEGPPLTVDENHKNSLERLQHRDHRRGMGLGLSLVQFIAEKFGGSVSFTREPTTFVLRWEEPS